MKVAVEMSDQGPAAARQIPDFVLGVFARDDLSHALAATHRAGFGPYTRVFDGNRSGISAQLGRAGLEVASGPHPAQDDLVIVVQAPGRVDRVAELFHQIGAAGVALACRQGARPAVAEPEPLAPRLDLPDLRLQAAGESS